MTKLSAPTLNDMSFKANANWRHYPFFRASAIAQRLKKMGATHAAVDGYYSKVNFVHTVVERGLHLVGKLLQLWKTMLFSCVMLTPYF